MKISLLLTQAHACSYLPQETAQLGFVAPKLAKLGIERYSELARRGFRRSGEMVYRPHCPACTACLSLRVPVARFRPTRSQRRIRQRNGDLTVTVVDARFQEEHFELYGLYLDARHANGDMSGQDRVAYREYLCADWEHTMFLELRLGKQLLAVAVTDRLTDGLSAVYTFFDPTLPHRSLGVYSILTQIRFAADIGLEYVYLGYWIADCRKMAYKQGFAPAEIFFNDRWIPLGESDRF